MDIKDEEISTYLLGIEDILLTRSFREKCDAYRRFMHNIFCRHLLLNESHSESYRRIIDMGKKLESDLFEMNKHLKFVSKMDPHYFFYYAVSSDGIQEEIDAQRDSLEKKFSVESFDRCVLLILLNENLDRIKWSF